MLKQVETGRTDLITAVLQLIGDKLPPEQAATVHSFARQYYSQVDPEDLAERAIADLYGAVLSHWHFARAFVPGTPKVRVYNPRLEEHGWQSTRAGSGV